MAGVFFLYSIDSFPLHFILLPHSPLLLAIFSRPHRASTIAHPGRVDLVIIFEFVLEKTEYGYQLGTLGDVIRPFLRLVDLFDVLISSGTEILWGSKCSLRFTL